MKNYSVNNLQTRVRRTKIKGNLIIVLSTDPSCPLSDLSKVDKTKKNFCEIL